MDMDIEIAWETLIEEPGRRKVVKDINSSLRPLCPPAGRTAAAAAARGVRIGRAGVVGG